MSAGHTPGPWIVCVENGDPWGARTVFAEDQLENGVISAGGWDWQIAAACVNHDDYEANARLIAAAPDLLGALRDCALVMQGDLKGLAVIQPELRGALAAIFKATGETF